MELVKALHGETGAIMKLDLSDRALKAKAANIIERFSHQVPAQAGDYVLVPREPTEEMCEAGWVCMPDSIADAYKSMIAAATKTKEGRE